MIDPIYYNNLVVWFCVVIAAFWVYMKFLDLVEYMLGIESRYKKND